MITKRRFILYAALISFGLWAILPPLLTLEASFMRTYAFINPIRAIAHMTLDNWRYLPYGTLARGALNSLIVCGASTAGGVMGCVMAGFGFAKYQFRGKDSLFMLFLLAMMIPVTLLFLPRFMIIRAMGLFDTHLAMILPMLIYPAGVFFARQYIMRLPDELIEQAKVDGASEWAVFRYVIAPLCRPLVAVLSLFMFVHVWQQFMWQYLVVRSPESMTLVVQLGLLLRGLAGGGAHLGLSEHSPVSLEGLQAAGSVMMAMPPLVVFLIGQPYFIQGLIAGGLKE